MLYNILNRQKTIACFIVKQIFCCHIVMLCCVVVSVSSDGLALCSYHQREGHTAQVAVSGGVINDAFSVEFALYLKGSVVLHGGKTDSHNW